jgi:hypothetical protein
MEDLRCTTEASFKYLLFNHYEQIFTLKHSYESRLFSPKSLRNMDYVQNEIC